jgi:pyruvate carboxylase
MNMDNPSNLKLLVIDDTLYPTRHTPKYEKRKVYSAGDSKKIFAFIPGLIDQIHVKKDQKVKSKTVLLILEAMKMKNHVTCQTAGTIKEIYVRQGQTVAKGELLLELE